MAQESQFFDEMILKRRPPIPDLLYHYTTIEGLLGIVKTGRLWLSHIKYLNDAREHELLWQLLAQRIEQRIQEADLPPGSPERKRLESLLEFRAPAETFVCSFTDDGGDRLSQWRGYASSCVGFSIGISGLALEEVVKQFNEGQENYQRLAASVQPVIYLGDDDARRFDEIIDNAWKPPVEHPLAPADRMFTSLMSAFAWVYKHSSFREEQEWRLSVSSFPFSPARPANELSPAMKRLVYGPVEPAPGLCFRPGKSLLIPYREVDVRKIDPKFIKRITMGPAPHPELSEKSVNDLCRSVGLQHVEFKTSDVPYRNW